MKKRIKAGTHSFCCCCCVFAEEDDSLQISKEPTNFRIFGQMMDTLIALSSCSLFKKSASFISYGTVASDAPTLVVEKGFLHHTWHLGIDLRHVDDLQLCSGRDVLVCVWVWVAAAADFGGTMSHSSEGVEDPQIMVHIMVPLLLEN